MECSVCGKDLEMDGTGVAMLTLIVESGQGKDEKEFMQRFAGPYKLDHNYNICAECYLRSLGVPAVGKYRGES